MDPQTDLWRAREYILEDAIQRDATTARRATLLEILSNERFLTRDQLIARVNARLRKSCFGTFAWEDNFYRDMRVVKKAFSVAGYRLLYSRSKKRFGYYLENQPALSSKLQRLIRSSADEVDPSQLVIYHRLSPRERLLQGCSISNTARKVVAYRIREEHPGLTISEANRLALKRAYGL